MNCITTTLGTIKGMLRFVAKNDIRDYFNALHIRQDARGTFLEATDGHIMGILRISKEACEPRSILIHPDYFDKIKVAKRDRHCVCDITVADDGSFKIDTMGMTYAGRVLNDRYPDVHRIVPSRKSLNHDAKEGLASGVGQYQARFLQTFEDAAADIRLDGKCLPMVWHRSESAALVDIGVPEFFGAMMPFRNHLDCAPLPVWADEPAKTALKVAA